MLVAVIVVCVCVCGLLMSVVTFILVGGVTWHVLILSWAAEVEATGQEFQHKYSHDWNSSARTCSPLFGETSGRD